ncbi:MAG: Hsp33 family molecular chaperone HslO [Candidatus Competibacterales bacterium]
MPEDRDTLTRFVFAHRAVRGGLVSLDTTWTETLRRRTYPEAVGQLLGQAMAATVLMSANLKFEGQLALQLQGSGPVGLLLAQYRHDGGLRGLARWREEVGNGSLQTLCGGGTLTLTLDPEARGERYQGLVPLEGDRLTDALEGYFARSEQLPTALWLAANGQRAVGLMLQRLPDAAAADWRHFEARRPDFDALDLIAAPRQTLLQTLAASDDLRVFDPQPVTFQCGCSRARIAAMLRGLGRHAIQEILVERQCVDVACQFCGLSYTFDGVDVEELFSGSEGVPAHSTTRH